MGTTTYFQLPFCAAGNKVTIPATGLTTGPVNYQYGWGTYYALAPSDPSSLDVPRTGMNQVFYDITVFAQAMQQWGTPNFITSTDNGGSPFPYGIYAKTLFSPSNWGTAGDQLTFVSNANSNTQTPNPDGSTANWDQIKGNEQYTTLQHVIFDPSVANGMPVYFDGAVFQPAIANGSTQQNVVGIADVDHNLVITGGWCTVSGVGPGAPYYLSSTVPGDLETKLTNPNVFLVGIGVGTDQLSLSLQNISTAVSNGRIPGETAFFAMITPPAGWLLMNGASLLRTDYPALFDAIGITYGSVDGTHFTLPNTLGTTTHGYMSRPYTAGVAGAFGSKVEDTYQDHTHNYQSGPGGGSGAAAVSSVWAGNYQTTIGSTPGFKYGTETAPKHILFINCIKY